MDGGFDIQSDAEIYFQGSMESDAGLKFGVHVQLEANNEEDKVTVKKKAGHATGGATEVKPHNTEIDESFAWMSGEFGRIEIGQRDPIHARTHYPIQDVGIGLQSGDTQKWIPGQYLGTAGWFHDNLNVIYITPRVSGVQLGVSYGADANSENSVASAPSNNDDSVWAAGINFNETIGDMSFKVSLGHMNRSQSAGLEYNAMNAAPAADADAAAMATAAEDDETMGYDNHTFTNAGLQLGMGAFTFAVSYATRDQGKFMPECWIRAQADNGANKDLVACGTAGENGGYPEADDPDNPGTDVPIDGILAIEDPSGKSDTWGASVMYSDGPVSISLGHMVEEFDDNTERAATMLSASYTLAPGVSWATSIFGVEDDTKAGAGKNKAAGMTEGTAFVTGLKIGF